MKRASVFAAIGLCAALAGCEKKHEGPTAEPTGTAAAPGRPTLGAPGAATTTTTPGAAATGTMTMGVADQDIPVQADFEEEAERDLVPGNLDAELTRIEKELAASTTTEGGALPPGGAGAPGGASTGGTGQPAGTTHPSGAGPHPGGTTTRSPR